MGIFPPPAADQRLVGTEDIGAMTADVNGSLGEKLQDIRDQFSAGGDRIHIRDPRKWMYDVGTDWWFDAAGIVADTTVDVGEPEQLRNWGWGVDGGPQFAGENGTGALFTEQSRWFTSNTEGLITTHQIFGTRNHKILYEELLGITPTTIAVDWWGVWNPVANNEAIDVASWGFCENSSPASTSEWVLGVRSDGVNWWLNVEGTDRVQGAAVDTDFHKHTIKYDGSTAYYYIDDALQGSYATTINNWPACFAPVWRDSGSNDPRFSLVHIWYE